MQAILISLHPEYWEMMVKGIKTIELRKIAPRISTPYKVYVYVTSKSTFSKECITGRTFYHGSRYSAVMGEFVCDQVFNYVMQGTCRSDIRYNIPSDHLAATGLTYEQVESYGDGRELRGLHIQNLLRYTEPKSLHYFCRPCDPVPGADCEYCRSHGRSPRLQIPRPPQSWCYVEEKRKAAPAATGTA